MDYSLESSFVKKLDKDITEFVLKGMENRDEASFQELALREFELQYNTVAPYRE